MNPIKIVHVTLWWAADNRCARTRESVCPWSCSWSISTKAWDRVGIELATPGSAVRRVKDYANGPDQNKVLLPVEYLVLPFISNGKSVVHQWYYQWKSVVKFVVITSGTPVVSIGISVIHQWFPLVYQWYASGFHWYISGKPVFSSGIPLEISGKIWWYYQWYTSVFQWYYQWYTGGIPL